MFANNPRIVTNGIVGAWDALMPNTATAATKLYDAVGSTDGTMYNGICFDFDGTDDLVLASDPVITGAGDFTLTAWINRATINTYDFICGNYSSPVNASGIEFYGIIGGEIRCYILGSVTTSTALVAGTWYHVGVRRLAGVVQLYINGVADGSPVSRTTSITGNLNFAIGNGPNYTSENFDGKIADVKAFNVALSTANMKELYDDSRVIIPTKSAAAGGFVSQTNLKGWWPLAEGAGAICYDGSGNGYDGIASSTDGDEWLTGKTGAPQLVEGYNRPMLFDGSSDYVDCGTDSSLHITGDITVAAWVYWAPGSTGENVIYCDGAYCETCGTLLQTRSATTLRFMHNTGSVYYFFDAGTGWDAGSWHHVAMTYSTASTTMTGYIDGASFATDSSGTAATGSRTNATTIGKASWTAGRYWPGIINEVIVYNTPLALADIQALAATGPNGGPLPPDPMALSTSGNIVSYWRNDGNLTWVDRAAAGMIDNTGTATGSPDALLFKQGYNGSKSTSTGRDGQGFPLKFKNVGALGMQLGVEDAVNLGSAPAFAQIANPGAATIGTWIRVDSASDLNALMGPWVSTGNAGWGIFTAYSGGINMIVDDGADGSGYWVGQNTPKVVVPADGSFHYVLLTVVRNGVGSDASVSHYLDGVFYNTKTFSNENGANAWGSGGSTVFKLGNMNGNTNYFNGQIANLQMYNRALTLSEITQNYNAQRSRFNV